MSPPGKNPSLGGLRHPFLENLALAARGATEPARRNARRAPEGAYEVREVGEARLQRHVGNGDVLLREELRRAREAKAQQVLMRRHAEHALEDAQEMERRETRLARCVLE